MDSSWDVCSNHVAGSISIRWKQWKLGMCCGFPWKLMAGFKPWAISHRGKFMRCLLSNHVNGSISIRWKQWKLCMCCGFSMKSFTAGFKPLAISHRIKCKICLLSTHIDGSISIRLKQLNYVCVVVFHEKFHGWFQAVGHQPSWKINEMPLVYRTDNFFTWNKNLVVCLRH